MLRGSTRRGFIRHRRSINSTSASHGNLKTPASVPVAIVGGGPVGLYTHLLLKRLGVESVLLERAGKTPANEHPRAHVLHTRTMELMRQVGIEQDIYDAAPPHDEWRHFRYCESVIGPDLGVVDHFLGESAKRLAAASPTQGISHLSQPKLESIIHDAILRQDGSGDGLLYGRQVVDATQNNGQVP